MSTIETTGNLYCLLLAEWLNWARNARKFKDCFMKT